MDLSALQDFVTVVLHGGFAAAARARGLPKSSLSRRVRQLEEQLSVRLLDRSSRTIRLTTEGTELYQRAAQTLAELEEVEQTLLARGAPRGRLRVAAPSLSGNLFLGHVAARYHAAYPQVELEISVYDRAVDLLAEGFDAAIRVNAPDSGEFVQRKFASARMALVASPRVAEREPRLGTSPRTELPTVCYDNCPIAAPWSLRAEEHSFEVVPRQIMRLSTPIMVRDAVVGGVGFALLPHVLTGPDVASGRLVELGYERDVDLSIVHPSRRLVSPRLRSFIDMLVAAFPRGQLSGPPYGLEQRIAPRPRSSGVGSHGTLERTSLR
ncbi:MAG: LysR family transcriptional regulator [Myxococcaceae bacterium]|nr:LysR family transcriptional regulator [Myxococcaceae bacterium]